MKRAGVRNGGKCQISPEVTAIDRQYGVHFAEAQPNDESEAEANCMVRPPMPADSGHN